MRLRAEPGHDDRDRTIRVVLSPGGRGAWLCPDPVCLDAAVRSGAINRALRRGGRLVELSSLEAAFAGEVERRG